VPYRSRKIKEVDFGFSLGLGPLGPESGEPSQPASQPTSVVAEPPRRRPSIFDIPVDEPREERRGSKRRRLGMYIGLQRIALLIWLKNHRPKPREHLMDRTAR
jgi:hypothetical protein